MKRKQFTPILIIDNKLFTLYICLEFTIKVIWRVDALLKKSYFKYLLFTQYRFHFQPQLPSYWQTNNKNNNYNYDLWMPNIEWIKKRKL